MLSLVWLLNVSYFLLLLAVSPLLLFRSIVYGKYRDGWNEKLWGNLPCRVSSGPCVWFHAVSVGEVLQLQAVVAELKARHPECEVVVSTTTSTGHAVARDRFPHDTVCYFPLDFSWAVNRALMRVRPSLVALVELELWPNFVLAASRQAVPLVLINGRISDRSYRGYRHIRPIMRCMLRRFQVLAAQNETYAQRLIDLGAPSDRVEITGTIKFDRIETDRQNPRTLELRRAFGIGSHERVLVAGSTQNPEERYALETWLALRDDHPDLRLILVPRHKERFDEVAQLVSERGLDLIRRSTIRPAASTSNVASTSDATPAGSQMRNCPPVLLLDTLGELAACWGLADIAFVGGSLTNRGGQNMIEPAGYGATVLFGPNTHNFYEIVEALLGRKAARVVTDARDLTGTVRYFLEHPEASRQQGEAAQEFVLSQSGATARTVALILATLS